VARTHNIKYKGNQMGRPLKIAKAQAVLTITGTDATTEEVTVSQTLASQGVIAGMPFVTATNVGGMLAGTTYWILNVTGASTFTVSATPLNANPTYTPVNLSATTGQTVATSVGVVDSGFNNPAGISNTYSVVGGNTSIYGSQVLCRVAIGQTGNGTIYGDSANTNIYGEGTDLANTLSVGSAVQVASANINGSTDYIDIGFVSTLTGYITVAVANTNATGNVIRTTGNAQTLFVGAPVTFDANTGGLVSDTTYFVKTIANASAFTVSNIQYGPVTAVTTGTATANATIDVAVLAANATANFTNASYVYANDEAGFIVRQKGKQKYLVQGASTGLVAQCQTANVANTALTPNAMNIIATYANTDAVFVQSLSDHNLEIFGNTAPGLQNAEPAYGTFNAAEAANVDAGIAYPIVSINKA
jgi:hypothetical protein